MEKKVDESWKEQVEKEKSALRAPEPPPNRPRPEPGPQSIPRGEPGRGPSRSRGAAAVAKGSDTTRLGAAPPAGEFSTLLSSLSMQALMALGELPHPATQAVQEDLEQARYLIDVLGMLQEKTKGNLTAEESVLIEDLLYELRMKYVAKTGSPAR